MRVTSSPALEDKFCAEAWSSNDWLTILYTLRKELKAASAVFPALKDFEIQNTSTPTKKRGK